MFSHYNFIFQRLIWKEISVYFLWFDYWIRKSAEPFCLSILFAQMIGSLFDIFTATMFIFSSARSLNICKPRIGWPTSFDILWSGLACLPSWLGMMNTGWLGSIQSDIFLQMKFIIFKAVPSNRLPYYLGSQLHVVSSLFGHFCLFQNAVLCKMLKLGFRNFKPIFLRIQFLFFQFSIFF